MHPLWIPDSAPPRAFPDVDVALLEPNGLLALGGNLSAPRLLYAYAHGIFPWYSEEQPIMWWSPSPRCVMYPDELIVRRSLKKTMRNADYYFSMDTAFSDVINACSAPRDDEGGTWITQEMKNAYIHLHQLGVAHSAEIWKHGELVGGLYGIAIGQVFFGESMFSQARDASKVALVCMTDFLRQHKFQLIDTQVTSAHLLSLGAREIDRVKFLALLDEHCHIENDINIWQTEPMRVKDYNFNDE